MMGNVVTHNIKNTCQLCSKPFHPDHGTLCFSHAIQTECKLRTKYCNKKAEVGYSITHNRYKGIRNN